MRICIDAYHAIGGYGGIHRYTVNLIKGLLKIDSENQYLLFYNFFREKGHKALPDFGGENAANITFRFPRRFLTRMWDTIRFPPIELLTGKIDVYHSLHFLLPPQRQGKSILTIHDTTYLKNLKFFYPDPLNAHGYKVLLPDAAKRAHRIIAISNSTKKDCIELLKVPEEKIEVIYFGVGEKYKPMKDEGDLNLLKKIGIEGDFILYCLGTIEPRKNIKNLLDAYKLFIERYKREVSLVLVGVGNFPEEVRRKIREHNMIGKVVLKENLSEEYIPVLMNWACLFIYPSLYEGFGLPVLEAMACGKAVIASNVSAIPEIVGDAGVLVDPQNPEEIAETLEQMLTDEELRNSLGKKALARSRLFSWERCARETLKVYRG